MTENEAVIALESSSPLSTHIIRVINLLLSQKLIL